MPADSIEIVEVSARDGLQNEKRMFSTDQKIALIRRMVEAGARRLEVASFAHPARVPQMADAEAVIAGLSLPADVITIGLVMNKKGLFRALETAVREIGVVAVASDTFAEKNQGQTATGSVEMACDVIRLALSEGRRAQVTIAASFGCPFEGIVPPERVVSMARALAEAGPHEIALADTIGVAVPQQVSALVRAVREAVPGMPLRIHLHDTRNTAVANAWAAVEAGISTLDSALGGIGGCPFAPNATGNVATEDLLYMLHRSGVQTGYGLEATIDAAHWLTDQMERVLPGLVSRASAWPPVD